jgi:hypothetical protein
MKRILVLFTTLLLAPLAEFDPIGQRRNTYPNGSARADLDVQNAHHRTHHANLRVAILSYRSGIRQNSCLRSFGSWIRQNSLCQRT